MPIQIYPTGRGSTSDLHILNILKFWQCLHYNITAALNVIVLIHSFKSHHYSFSYITSFTIFRSAFFLSSCLAWHDFVTFSTFHIIPLGWKSVAQTEVNIRHPACQQSTCQNQKGNKAGTLKILEGRKWGWNSACISSLAFYFTFMTRSSQALSHRFTKSWRQQKCNSVHWPNSVRDCLSTRTQVKSLMRYLGSKELTWVGRVTTVTKIQVGQKLD